MGLSPDCILQIAFLANKLNSSQLRSKAVAEGQPRPEYQVFKAQTFDPLEMSLLNKWEWVLPLVQGSLNKFPDIFHMGTFMDSTHMKLWRVPRKSSYVSVSMTFVTASFISSIIS